MLKINHRDIGVMRIPKEEISTTTIMSAMEEMRRGLLGIELHNLPLSLIKYIVNCPVNTSVSNIAV